MTGNGTRVGETSAHTGIVVCVGVDYHTASVALRERVALSFADNPTQILHVEAQLAEALVLSTCNRFEIYTVVDAAECEEVSRRVVHLIASRMGMDADELRQQMYLATGSRAIRHLFRVAAGRESMVIGETQIVAQLKRALAEAERVGALGGTLHRMGSCALAASRRVRRRTVRSQRSTPPSVCSLAVDRVAGQTALRDARIVVVGAGDTAIDLLIALCARRGCRDRITVVNRTNARASSLAKRFRVGRAEWSELPAIVASADIVFCCTSAAQPVLTRDIVAARCASLPPLLLVDLGVPRNVTPDLVECSSVSVMDMDVLAIHAADMPDHSAAAADLEVNYWVQHFEGWLRRRTIVPTLAELQSNIETIRQREFERARARLGNLDERQLEVVSLLSRRLVNQLLHRPLSTLAAHPESEELARSARRLFDLSR